VYDLVTSLYVHVAGSVEEMVSRLASGIAPGGTLVLVGHLPIDPTSGAETPAAGQMQVTVEAAVAVLDPHHWETLVAESDRERYWLGLRLGDLRATPNLIASATTGEDPPVASTSICTHAG